MYLANELWIRELLKLSEYLDFKAAESPYVVAMHSYTLYIVLLRYSLRAYLDHPVLLGYILSVISLSVSAAVTLPLSACSYLVRVSNLVIYSTYILIRIQLKRCRMAGARVIWIYLTMVMMVYLSVTPLLRTELISPLGKPEHPPVPGKHFS